MIKSEKEFIAFIRAKFADRSSALVRTFGEDCAVLNISGNKCFLISCDDFIEGRHYEHDYVTLMEAGEKALLANISDIISMGGIPLYYMVSLLIPEKFKKERALQVYQGMGKAAKKYRIALLGGNTEAYSGPLAIRITIIGEMQGKHIFCRNKARHGDLVCITNKTGLSALGLLLLQRGWQKHKFVRHKGTEVQRHKVFLGKGKVESIYYDNKGNIEKRAFIKHAIREFIRPSIPFSFSQFLARHALPHAVIDISDGLVSDLYEICKESKVGALLDKDALPVDTSALHFCLQENIDYYKLVLSGGEDYQLLFTITPKNFLKLKKLASKHTFYCIGKIIKDSQCQVKLQENNTEQILPETLGYDHFTQ